MDDVGPDRDAEVLFFEVESGSAKRECLGVVAARYFLAGHRLLFAVDGLAAAEYLDQLLWSYPPAVMLPHVVTEEMSSERIVISASAAGNLNNAAVIVNLRESVVDIAPPCRSVVEFWDLSTAEREKRSLAHWEEYQRRGIPCRRQMWSGPTTPIYRV